MEDWGEVKDRLEYEAEHAVSKQHRADIRAALERVEELEQERAGMAHMTQVQRERAEAAEAKLARCVEALSAYVSQDAAFAEDHSLCGDCEWALRYSRARAALAAAKGE